MRIIPIELFTDNFCYFIFGKDKQNSILVDPADHNIVTPFLKRHPEHKITHILLTHHHSDHLGKLRLLLKDLKQLYGDNEIQVISGHRDRIKDSNVKIKEDSSFNIGEIKITTIMTPCHTKGAVVFYLENEDFCNKENEDSMVKAEEIECIRCVFTGDTLFIGGCGRFMEGNAEQMLENMDKLATLPKDTFVFPGHDYTAENLKWAMGIEWENEAYKKKLEWVENQKKKGLRGIPSKIGEESEINIFWRTRNETIKKRVEKENPIEVMGALRDMKNRNVCLK